MAGLFKQGDKVQTVYSEAIAGHERVIGVVVLSEDSPGQYRCQTSMGIAVMLSEVQLAPATSAVQADLAVMNR